MPEGEFILQNWVLTKFILPFFLVFFIVFAILEKTKVFGEDRKQLNALISFVIGLIFVGVAYPVEVVSNLILFLTIALIVVFVALLIWGFLIGEEPKLVGDNAWLKWGVGGVVGVIVILALIWAAGIDVEVINFFFYQDWSGQFWTNVLFIAAIAGALAVVLRSGSSK